MGFSSGLEGLHNSEGSYKGHMIWIQKAYLGHLGMAQKEFREGPNVVKGCQGSPLGLETWCFLKS